jgi:hypothetical protein
LHGASCDTGFAAPSFVGHKTTLDKADAPLNIPAQLLGMRFLVVTLVPLGDGRLFWRRFGLHQFQRARSLLDEPRWYCASDG